MNPQEERLSYLFQQFQSDSLSGPELTELSKWFDEARGNASLREYMAGLWQHWQQEAPAEQPDWDRMMRQIISVPVIKHKSRFPRKWLAAASVLLLMLSGAVWYYNSKDSKKLPVVAGSVQQQSDAVPGGNKAILTLANGSKIILDSAANGTIGIQGNAKISKLANGLLSYNASADNPGEIVYNTLSTPRGGQYQLLLPDGTKVWLNAASSIKYPAVFAGKERQVEITGEAYFEVKHDANMPFRVKAGKALIEDIGTGFNINAYTDEPAIKTTLLEGSVKIATTDNDRQEVLLKPGEQAQLISGQAQTKRLTVVRADIQQTMAWKSGFFAFRNADLPAVLRQLSRWYDVKAEYEGTIPVRKFTGKIERKFLLSQVLKILENQEVHFKIDNKTIIVMP